MPIIITSSPAKSKADMSTSATEVSDGTASLEVAPPGGTSPYDMFSCCMPKKRDSNPKEEEDDYQLFSHEDTGDDHHEAEISTSRAEETLPESLEGMEVDTGKDTSTTTTTTTDDEMTTDDATAKEIIMTPPPTTTTAVPSEQPALFDTGLVFQMAVISAVLVGETVSSM